LKLRDAKFVEDYEKWFATKAFADAGVPQSERIQKYDARFW